MRDWVPWLLGVLIAVAAAGLARARLAARDGRPRTRRPPTAPPRRGRAGSRPGGTMTAPPRPGRAPSTVVPKPGQIWWADVPFADGTGSKVRPCLVLRAGRGGADVLKITSQDKSGRADHVRIPTRNWDRNADHDSYLDLSDPIAVSVTAFEDRAGDCDPVIWRQVRRLHGPRGPR